MRGIISVIALRTVEGRCFACLGKAVPPKIGSAIEDADIVKIAGELTCGALFLAYSIIRKAIIEGIPGASIVDSVGIS